MKMVSDPGGRIEHRRRGGSRSGTRRHASTVHDIPAERCLDSVEDFVQAPKYSREKMEETIA